MSQDNPTFAEIAEENIRSRRSAREMMFDKLAEIQAGLHTVRIVKEDHND